MKKTDFHSVGKRNTTQREQILEVLKNTPLTINQIKTSLESKRVQIHLVTLYRTMQTLKEMNIVQETIFDNGIKYYELKTNHHHHMICNNCGSIKDFAIINESQFFKKLERKEHFLITSHQLEFSGLCPQCQ